MAPTLDEQANSVLEGVKKVRIPEQKYFDSVVFPLVLSPQSETRTAEYWFSWIEKNKENIGKLLLKHGTILFRGFPLTVPENFDSFCKSFGYKHLSNIGGVTPRKHVTGNVFTSNEVPPDFRITFHHEMNQYPIRPNVVFFYCDIPPAEGGQTPIVLSSEVYKQMVEKEPEFVERLDNEGIRHTVIMGAETNENFGYGRGWKQSFCTEDKEVVERIAKEQLTEIDWLPGGNLRATRKRAAFRVDGRTQKKTWFNSSILAITNDPMYTMTFQNGDPFPKDSINNLDKVLDGNAVDSVWQKGDVMMIDNMQVMHARRTFTPPRRILASLYL